MRRQSRRGEPRNGGHTASLVFTGLFGLAFATIFIVSYTARPRQPAVIEAPYTPPASPEPKPKTWPIAPPSPEVLRREALDQIVLEGFDWKREGFGMVAMASFTIKNNGRMNARNIEVACTFFAEDGSNIGTKRKQTYEQADAGRSVTLPVVNFGLIPTQAKTIRCAVSDAALSTLAERSD